VVRSPGEAPRRGRARAALAAVLLGALLAGCANVPTSGPLQTHAPEEQQVNSTVEVAPVPPPAGASAMLIVAGYSIARQYLTAEASNQWKPEAGTRVFADGSLPAETETSIVLVAPVTGQLDADGGYHEVSEQLHHDFELVRDGTEWRISNPPEGLLISRYAFTTGFLGVSLSYLDSTGTVMVPDPRFFPQNLSLATTVLRAQLDGPGAWLAPVVRTDFDAPATLLGVELDGSTMRIQLDSGPGSLPRDQRDALLGELTLTATQLPGVSTVQVRAGAVPLSLGSSGEVELGPQRFAALAAAEPQGPGALFVSTAGRVQRYDGLDWVNYTAVAPGILDPRWIAVRHDLQRVAAVTADGTQLVTSTLTDETVSTVAEGTDLGRPEYSRSGELWLADGGALRVFAGEDEIEVGLDAATLPKGSVSSFRLSPDGVRIALVIQGRDANQLGIARVDRTPEGISLAGFRPVSVAGPLEGKQLVDVGWTSPTRLLVLLAHGADTVSVVRVDQDSARADDIGPGKVADLSELAVVPGRQAVVRSGTALYRYEGDFNWKLSLSGVGTATYSG
jgi:hypothetical protein